MEVFLMIFKPVLMWLGLYATASWVMNYNTNVQSKGSNPRKEVKNLDDFSEDCLNSQRVNEKLSFRCGLDKRNEVRRYASRQLDIN